jgi:hypothetical protein
VHAEGFDRGDGMEPRVAAPVAGFDNVLVDAVVDDIAGDDEVEAGTCSTLVSSVSPCPTSMMGSWCPSRVSRLPRCSAAMAVTGIAGGCPGGIWPQNPARAWAARCICWMVCAEATTWAPGNRSARLAAVNQWWPCAWVAKICVSFCRWLRLGLRWYPPGRR